MRQRRYISGLSVVELLVVLALAGITLSLLTMFFTAQARTTRQTQARNEVEAKVRLAAEIIIQDLQVTGASVVFNGGNPTNVALGCIAGSLNPCARRTSPTLPLTVRYATSLRPVAAACRRVDYKLTSTNILQRVEQGGANCTSLAAPTDPATYNLNPLAQNITNLTITYICADETTEVDPINCYTKNSFPRQASVSVVGRSDADANVTARVVLTTTMPNMKN